MSSKTFRHQLLLGTALLAAGLIVFDTSSAFATPACTNIPVGNFICTGTYTTTQGVYDPNYTGTTQASLSITTTTGNALYLNGGAGGITFVDGDNTHAIFSTTAASGIGIYATNSTTGTGDLAVTLGKYSSAYGGGKGIYVKQQHAGSASITVNGRAESGASGFGVAGYVGPQGTDLNITSAAGSTISGGTGISATNLGTGDTTIKAYGTVTGTNSDGINALSAGAVNITTGSSSTVTGSFGIVARNYGTGSTTITAYGTVTGTSVFGILASNNNPNGTGALNITTGSSSNVTGSTFGIFARNYGAGSTTTITTGGIVASGMAGSYNVNGHAIQTVGGPVTVSNLVTGNIIGTLTLGANTTGNTLTNAGAWITTGTSDFASTPSAGSVLGTVNNMGVINAAVGTGTSTTTFNNAGTFTNSGLLSLSTQTAGNGATPANTLTINGNFAGGGTLKIDAFLGGNGSKSDTLTVNGNVTGTTKVAIVNTNASLGALNTGTVFATVNGTAAANNFVMANGPITSGLFIYDIKEVNVSSTRELFELFS